MSKRKSVISGLSGRRVIDSLVSAPAKTDSPEQGSVWIPIERVRPGPFQQREYFSETSINALAAAIKTQGFQVAVNVREADDGFYDIIAGESRWRAAKIAGLDKVLCKVGEFTELEALKFGLSENLLRQDLSQLEQTRGILKLIEVEFGLTQDEAVHIVNTEGHNDARRNDSTSEHLQNILSVLETYNIDVQTFRTKHLPTLKMPDELKEAHLEKNLPYTAALEINKLKDPDIRKALLDEVLEKKLSVREIKQRVKEEKAKGKVVANQSEASVLERLAAITKRAKGSKLLTDESKRQEIEQLLARIEQLLT